MVVLEDGSGVVIPPALVRPVLAGLQRDSIRAAREDGIRLSEPARTLFGALRDAMAANAVPAGSAVGTKSWVFPDGGAEWLTCDQSSKVLDCSTNMVRRLAREGKLDGAVRLAGVWLMPAASVWLYRARRPA